jgi:hypothetical protein
LPEMLERKRENTAVLIAQSFGQVVDFAPLDNPLDLSITSNRTLLWISITSNYMCFSPLRRKTSKLEGEEYTSRLVSGIT